MSKFEYRVGHLELRDFLSHSFDLKVSSNKCFRVCFSHFSFASSHLNMQRASVVSWLGILLILWLDSSFRCIRTLAAVHYYSPIHINFVPHSQKRVNDLSIFFHILISTNLIIMKLLKIIHIIL